MRFLSGLLLVAFASSAKGQAPSASPEPTLRISLSVSVCGVPWAAPEVVGPALRVELAGVGRVARIEDSAPRRVEVSAPDCAHPAELALRATEGARERRARTSLADVLPESRPRVLALVLAELVVALDRLPLTPPPTPARRPAVLDVDLASAALRRPSAHAMTLATSTARWGLDLRARMHLAGSLAAASGEGPWLGASGGVVLRLPTGMRLGLAVAGARAEGRARLEGVNGEVIGRRLGALLDLSWLRRRGRLAWGPELSLELSRVRAEGRLGRSPALVQRTAVLTLGSALVAHLDLGRGVALRASLGLALPTRGYVALTDAGARVLGWRGLILPASVGLVVPLAGAPAPGSPIVTLRPPRATR